MLTATSHKLVKVLDEAVALNFRLLRVAEELHRQGPASSARRGILRTLSDEGPQSVPQMARARTVTRQHVQTLVNSLMEEGLVEVSKNPAHRKSSLIRLTKAGERAVRDHTRREAVLVKEVTPDVDSLDLEGACEVLRRVREFLESERCERLISRINAREHDGSIRQGRKEHAK
jgi:DNA-binding MarR family transcriptional regulator